MPRSSCVRAASGGRNPASGGSACGVRGGVHWRGRSAENGQPPLPAPERALSWSYRPPVSLGPRRRCALRPFPVWRRPRPRGRGLRPPEQSTDNARRSRRVDAIRTQRTDSVGPPPKHLGFRFLPGGPIRLGRGRLDGAVAAQTPLKDGQGSYQVAYKERDRYLRILEAYMALRKAAEPSQPNAK